MNKQMSVTTLFSGSGGNVIYVRSGDTEFLIDAGICAKGICGALKDLDTDITKISGIFITHEHIDHTKGIGVLSRRYEIPIHMTKPSANEYISKHGDPKTLVTHETSYEYLLGNILIRSFNNPHDSAACVGYTIESGGEKLGIATDLGYVDNAALDALCGCESVILESNYDKQMLEEGEYPYFLKQRIMSAGGHLSNYDCAAFAKYLAEKGTKNFMLSHLSQENNTPEIAYNVTSRALADFDDVTLKVAARSQPTLFV